MMNKSDAIYQAAWLAQHEDADMVVGQNDRGEWIIAHWEDLGRQAEMAESTKVVVRSDGPVE